MNNEYYESLGMIYESYEEGLISEDTKMKLIDKLKKAKEKAVDKLKKVNKKKLAKALAVGAAIGAGYGAKKINDHYITKDIKKNLDEHQIANNRMNMFSNLDFAINRDFKDDVTAYKNFLNDDKSDLSSKKFKDLENRADRSDDTNSHSFSKFGEAVDKRGKTLANNIDNRRLYRKLYKKALKMK